MQCPFWITFDSSLLQKLQMCILFTGRASSSNCPKLTKSVLFLYILHTYPAFIYYVLIVTSMEGKESLWQYSIWALFTICKLWWNVVKLKELWYWLITRKRNSFVVEKIRPYKYFGHQIRMPTPVHQYQNLSRYPSAFILINPSSLLNKLQI